MKSAWEEAPQLMSPCTQQETSLLLSITSSKKDCAIVSPIQRRQFSIPPLLITGPSQCSWYWVVKIIILNSNKFWLLKTRLFNFQIYNLSSNQPGKSPDMTTKHLASFSEQPSTQVVAWFRRRKWIFSNEMIPNMDVFSKFILQRKSNFFAYLFGRICNTLQSRNISAIIQGM